MKVYKGSCASPGLVLGQVSRLEHHVETTTVGPFKPSRELQLLTDAIRTAQRIFVAYFMSKFLTHSRHHVHALNRDFRTDSVAWQYSYFKIHSSLFF